MYADGIPWACVSATPLQAKVEEALGLSEAPKSISYVLGDATLEERLVAGHLKMAGRQQSV